MALFSSFFKTLSCWRWGDFIGIFSALAIVGGKLNSINDIACNI
jgi:hypothetical protein